MKQDKIEKHSTPYVGVGGANCYCCRPPGPKSWMKRAVNRYIRRGARRAVRVET